MVSVDLLQQLIDSMSEAVTRLEKAQSMNDVQYINELRVFIYDVQRQIDAVLNG